ncbi:undecaprenyl-phosphate glucose phosphotransferase [Qipengyuania aquimaris]|uniref:Undecaprenyl-phosphate glucose phosphotransferase n=1 Tax=Qipengyuania aquimaris TaxID=255984 RepID=A0A9Q3S1A4_9SPHN|nr:undecaprenyl-phosphate glucose phosphotransferase [Qipengyuania aquimaris]
MITLQRRTVGHLRVTSNVVRTLGVLNDVACFFLAFLLASIFYDMTMGDDYDGGAHRSAAIILTINFLLVRISRDGYAPFRGQGAYAVGAALVDCLMATALTLLVIIQLGKPTEFSIELAGLFISFAMILLFLSRLAFTRLGYVMMQRGYIGQRVAVYAESAQLAARVVQLVQQEKLPHLRWIGYADERARTKKDVDSIMHIGGFLDLLDLAKAGQLDQVILAMPTMSQSRLDEISEALSAASIDICILPSETLELSSKYRVNFLGSLPVFTVWQQPMRDIDGLLKETLDYVLATLALLLLSPIMILAALAIKLESRGPIIFKQKRFGFNNTEITVLKFRSMYSDLEDSSGSKRTEENDERVTRVGRFIRKTSIDELPQLLNVLKGEMSLVGPRPHATMMRVGDKFYFEAVKGYAARHRVKPGITGLAQVRGLRGEIATKERARRRVEHDIYYIENWSPALDIKILVKTIIKIAWDKNAY